VTVVTLARSPGTAVNPATVTTTTPETTTANNRAQASVPITGPFVPPKTQCAAVSVQHGALVAGHQVTVDVTAKRNGDAASGVRVSLHGPGIDVTKATDSGGHARFVVAPKSVGVLRIQVAQSADCATPPQEIPIPGAFKPPRLTG
jgi:hypothetical protein